VSVADSGDVFLTNATLACLPSVFLVLLVLRSMRCVAASFRDEGPAATLGGGLPPDHRDRPADIAESVHESAGLPAWAGAGKAQ